MSESAEFQSFLTGTPFFGGLGDEGLGRITRLLVERSFPSGAKVFKEGETGRSMFILVSGQVLMTRAGDSGLQVKLVRLGRGDFFGETTLIEMQPRPFTAVCETAVELLELTNLDLYKLYKDDVKSYVMVLQNINRELCRRLRHADVRIVQRADELQDEMTQIRPSVTRR
jgi:CRP/FNR family cyclic AMP-dependent transcriptional regulator